MKSRDLVEPFGSGVWLRRSIRSVRPHPEVRMREAQRESRDSIQGLRRFMGGTNPDRDREPESGWPDRGLPIGRIDTELGDGNDNELWSRRLPDIAKAPITKL